MATISKFYLLDAATPNTGTFPSNSPDTLAALGTHVTDAAGASTARDATDVKGTSNPDIESTFTSGADVLANRKAGHRRFVSRPLAAQTFAAADGNWSFSLAWFESNTNHTSGTGSVRCVGYGWSPSGGVRVGSGTQWVQVTAVTTGGATTETAYTATANPWATSLTISDGDVLVFDVYSIYTQGMSVAYTESFCYNGTTEASTTTCATFVAPPVPVTLYTAPGPSVAVPVLNMAPYVPA